MPLFTVLYVLVPRVDFGCGFHDGYLWSYGDKILVKEEEEEEGLVGGGWSVRWLCFEILSLHEVSWKSRSLESEKEILSSRVVWNLYLCVIVRL